MKVILRNLKPSLSHPFTTSLNLNSSPPHPKPIHSLQAPFLLHFLCHALPLSPWLPPLMLIISIRLDMKPTMLIVEELGDTRLILLKKLLPKIFEKSSFLIPTNYVPFLHHTILKNKMSWVYCC